MNSASDNNSDISVQELLMQAVDKFFETFKKELNMVQYKWDNLYTLREKITLPKLCSYYLFVKYIEDDLARLNLNTLSLLINASEDTELIDTFEQITKLLAEMSPDRIERFRRNICFFLKCLALITQ